MSKISMPRPRYIAFRIEAPTPVSRRALSNALKGCARHEGLAEEDHPQLTRFEHPHAIVRVPHERLAACRGLLGRIGWVVEGAAKVPVKVVTLSTGGTLLALTRRTGALQDRGEEKPASREPSATGRGPARPGHGKA